MKNKKIVIVVVGILLTVSALFFLKTSDNKKNLTNTPLLQDTAVVSESNEMSAEDVIKMMDDLENVVIPENVSAEIIGPEGETFQMSQARMYEAAVSNLPENARGDCSWKFYLNEYNEEVLYREMEGQLIQGTCSFTSTFIDKRGDLRVVVDIAIKDYYRKNVLKTLSAERMYKVL